MSIPSKGLRYVNKVIEEFNPELKDWIPIDGTEVTQGMVSPELWELLNQHKRVYISSYCNRELLNNLKQLNEIVFSGPNINQDD